MAENNEIQRTKAEFRAMRERLGMTRKTMADVMEVTVKSVKYWESPKSLRYPPQDAWDMLDDAIEYQRDIVTYTLNQISTLVEANGGIKPVSVKLPYWLSAEEYEENSQDSKYGLNGDWNMANANARLIEVILETMGIGVEWADLDPSV